MRTRRSPRPWLVGSVTAAAALAALVAGAPPARAWDGPTLWYGPADGATPAGGGVLGTGGQHDFGVTCADCHVEQAEVDVGVTVRFTPPLVESGGTFRYIPGQRYQIEAVLAEALLPPCGQFLTHVNGFAATFEDLGGRTVGLLESDSGQRQDACPTDYTDPTSGTTALYADCRVIIPREGEGMTRWQFAWTAPTGDATVRMYYGAVDGGCDMSSLGDAVVMGRRTLAPAAAGAAPAPALPAPHRPGPAAVLAWLLGLAVLLVASGAALIARHRRRRRARVRDRHGSAEHVRIT